MDIRTLARLDAGAAATVRALAAAAQESDGVAPLDEQTLLRLDPDSARAATHLLVPDDEDRLLAYAQVADGSAELVVHPGARRRGLGRALLRAVRATASAAGTDDAGTTDGGRADAGTADAGPADADADDVGTDATSPPAVWAHGDLAPARALAAAESLTRVRELLRMGARVEPGDIPADPPGVRVATFDVGRDAQAWLRVNARAFATHPEQGSMTRADLDERIAQPWFDPELLLLARDADAAEDADPVGFIWMKPGGDGEAELYVLGVDPAAQGRGLGRALTSRGLSEVAAQGRTAVDLYVEGDNAPAVATYVRHGFDVVERHSQYR